MSSKPTGANEMSVHASADTAVLALTADERKIERGLKRRLDMMIMPLVVMLFLLSYIDRQNYASARLQGLETDLKMNDIQYQVALSVFFVGYILAQIPSNMLLNYFTKPSVYIGTCVTAWGLLTTCTSQVTSYGSLTACRLLLGCLEAPFVCGVLYYLSRWYTRKEMNLRMGIFYSGSLISGAFGNLIAAGILNSLSGKRGMAAWQWLYIIEGSLTMFMGIIIMLVLPDYPQTWKWLSSEERAVAMRRLLIDAAEEDTDDETRAITQWEGVKLAMADPKTYICGAIHACIIGVISFQNFFPTLTATITDTQVKALLLAAPPYLFATLISCVHSYFADKMESRFWFFVYPAPFTVTGFAIFMAVASAGARYFSLFLVAVAFNMFGTFYSWVASSLPRPPAKRAAAIAFMNAVGNSSSIWTSFLYNSNSAPYYRTAFGTCIGLQVVAVLLACVLRWLLIKQNKELEQAAVTEHQRTTHPDENTDIEVMKDLRKNYRYLV